MPYNTSVRLIPTRELGYSPPPSGSEQLPLSPVPIGVKIRDECGCFVAPAGLARRKQNQLGMESRRRYKHTGMIALAALLLLLGGMAWLMYAQNQRREKSPLLLQAVRERNYYEVRILIEGGADPNSSADDWEQSDIWYTLKSMGERKSMRRIGMVERP